MKRIIVTLALIGLVLPAFGQILRDDFDANHTVGETPAGWDTMWDPNEANLPLQQGLFTVEDGVGRDGSRGLALDVTRAKRIYRTKFGRPAGGATLVVSMDIRITTTGEVLNGDTDGIPPAEEPNGSNAPLIGPVISPLPLWENGPDFSFGFARRDDNAWGVRVPGPPWIAGYESNSAIGLGPGLTPSTSDWFSMRVLLTDTGTQWEAMAQVYATDGETLLFQTGSYVLPPAFVSGAALYAGATVGWNNNDVPISEVGKLSALTVDNFVFGPPGTMITKISALEKTGYQFTSEVGKTHRLQYSTDGTSFANTGASVAGDGTVMTLVDPAADTAGRTYRVTSD